MRSKTVELLCVMGLCAAGIVSGTVLAFKLEDPNTGISLASSSLLAGVSYAGRSSDSSEDFTGKSSLPSPSLMPTHTKEVIAGKEAELELK